MSEPLPSPRPLTLSVPAAASTTTVGPAVAVGWPQSGLVLVATLTGMSAGTLDLYIQESWNGGATWNDVAHFTQIAANAAAASERLSVSTAGSGTAGNSVPVVVGTGTTAAPGVALAAGKFVDGPWGPLVRLVAVTGAGANAGPVSQTINLYPWRPSQGS